jgi:hypothetical protein
VVGLAEGGDVGCPDGFGVGLTVGTCVVLAAGNNVGGVTESAKMFGIGASVGFAVGFPVRP